MVTRKPPEPDAPLAMVCTMQIEAAAPADGQSTVLPRFRMVAYTGGPMRVAGWR